MNIDLIKQLLIIAIGLSTITCMFIQETKGMFKSSKWIKPYSFVVNMVLGVLFCLSFTNVELLLSLWVGLFAFIGADGLYKSLEGKLKPLSEMINKKIEVIERNDK